MKTGGNLWLLLIVLVLALLLRMPGLPWGIINHDYFEPDEGQHVAIGKNFINTFDNVYVKDAEVTTQFNARGFGTQASLLSYPLLKIFNLPSNVLFFSVRILSLIYSLLLIILIYAVTITVSGNNKIALLSALLLSIFDLNVTYSHYGVPDIAQVFWFYLSLFLIFLLYTALSDAGGTALVKKKWLIILTTLSVAMGLSFRFDPVPLLFFVGSVGLLAMRKKISPRDSLYLIFFSIIMICGFFSLSVGFNYNIKDFLLSKLVLNVHSLDVIPHDNHLLHNPALYFFAILSGTSIPLVMAFGASFLFFHLKERNHNLRRFNLFSLSFLIVSFVLLWVGDCTFVRRANIFLPYIAMMSGYGLVHFMETGVVPKSRACKKLIVSFLLLYTITLSLLSQAHFLRDTRYKASDYMKQHFTSKDAIAYSLYAKTESSPEGIPLEAFNPSIHTIVIHETYYGRYWKYFTTPFKIPECCDEVFHCTYNNCILIQNLFSGTTDYRLVKSFEVTHPFPERVIFKHLFGTYETFLGDVLIYRKDM